MPSASFRLYAELNDFLPREKRQIDINVNFNGHETVKHLLESLGVPHTEVDVILVDGHSVDFSHRLRGGERVSVYPIFETLDVSPLIRLGPEPLHEARFVLDGHLGKLANYLRLLGFDTRYRNDFDDDELAEISSREQRILLTRDRGLLKRGQVTHGYCIRAKASREQVIEVLRRFDLTGRARPFSRCARCNGILQPVSKDEVFDRLEPKTKRYYHKFQICRVCDQVYWKGSHFERMERQLQELVEAASAL